MYSPLRFLPSVFRKTAPVHLTFFVTRRCNARCPFCFYLTGEGNDDGHAAGEGELALDEVSAMASSLGDLLWVALSGGEIFLREDLVDICRVFYERNRPSIMLLPTNGLTPERIARMTEEVLRRCPQSVIAVKLSLDGPPPVHDAMREVPGSFQRVMESYRLLGEFLEKYGNFELGINTVFSRENEDHMDWVIEHVKGMERIKTHTISLVRGESVEDTYKSADMQKYLRAVERLEGGLRDGSSPTYRFRGARVKAAQDIIQRRLIHRTATENRRLLPCYAGRLNLVVTEGGDLYPCESFRREHLMGNLKDFGFDVMRALESRKARAIVSRIGKSCFCTHECYMMTNILFNPRMFPELLKETARVRGA
jgi:radical SAM protein with 4Fe4S-binding SPASM domain